MQTGFLDRLKEKIVKDDFENLMRMQHESNDTRLLDFTKNPLVALRFACGYPEENCRKKVTVFATDDDVLDKGCKDYAKKCAAFMKLVTCEDDDDRIAEILKENKEIFKKDYFVEVPQKFERIKRQDGLFLFMGNLTNSDMFSENPKVYKHKVMHELDEKFGRGPDYNGYVGVLKIAADCVNEIRNKLEGEIDYNMDYLMAKKNEVHSPCQP